MKASDMRVFDETATCPKCGGSDISTRHKSPSNICYGAGCPFKWESVEHMERTCRRCGWHWPEAPIDAARPTREGEAG